MNVEQIFVEQIDVVGLRRSIDEEAVVSLMASISSIGLMTPISARYFPDRPMGTDDDDSYVLIAGAHRLEAVRRLGWDKIPCAVFSLAMSDDDARMWEISENLHRANLTKEQRDEQIVEWAELAAKKKQVGEIPPPYTQIVQPKEKGYRQTARDLGVDPKEVRDAHKLADLAPDVKQAAKDAGLSRSETLKVARSAPEQQSARVIEISNFKSSGLDAELKEQAAKYVASFLSEVCPAERWDWLKSLLFTAGAKNIAHEFINAVGVTPAMDRSSV